MACGIIEQKNDEFVYTLAIGAINSIDKLFCHLPKWPLVKKLPSAAFDA